MFHWLFNSIRDYSSRRASVARERGLTKLSRAPSISRDQIGARSGPDGNGWLFLVLFGSYYHMVLWKEMRKKKEGSF